MKGPTGRHRGRSTRGHHAVRQEHSLARSRRSPWPTKSTLLHAPDVYMEKIAIGPLSKGVVDLDAPAGDNILKLAQAKGVRPEGITALILDRPQATPTSSRRSAKPAPP